MTATGQLEITIDEYLGDRHALRPLFELAEDSEVELNSYLHIGRVFVARIGEDVVGHLQLVDTGVPGEAELKSMAVRAEQQGRGVGARLIQAARMLLARLPCWVVIIGWVQMRSDVAAFCAEPTIMDIGQGRVVEAAPAS
jgi:GNAT superfamily N-acetyltransferase